MPIELHAFDTPNGRKISVALEEMALPYTINIVDIGEDQQYEPEFVEDQPQQQDPRHRRPGRTRRQAHQRVRVRARS